MLNRLKSLLATPAAPAAREASPPSQRIDANLAAAALMVRVIAADGAVEPAEIARMRDVLLAHYGLDGDEADELIAQAREADADAIDLYGFTSVLKSEMDEAERLGLVEDLWEMVYADGSLHESEDNVVWRVAELLGITSDKRIALKLRVKRRRDGQGPEDR